MLFGVSTRVRGWAAAAVVAGAIASCGGATAVTPAATSVPGPSPTSDPAVAAVTAVAKQFVEAVAATAKSGDAKGANSYIVPGAPARGNVGSTAEVGAGIGHNFITRRLDFREPVTTVTGGDATVDMDYSAYGHEADWPSLRPREGDHETTVLHIHIELQGIGGKWLVYAFWFA